VVSQSSPNIIKVIKSRSMRWIGHLACVGETRNSYKIFNGKPDRKRPCRRHRHRWKTNIRVALRELGWEGVDWIHLAKDKSSCRLL